MIIRKPLAATGVLLASLGIAACGSDDSPDRAASTATPTTTSAAPAAAVLQQQLTTFFDPNSPAAQRTAVVENGAQRAALLEQLGGVLTGYPLTAEVTEVTVDGRTATAVTQIAGPHGGAPIPVTFTQKDGAWVISDASTCQILEMGKLRCS
ncbi:nuclear transport factor 2 family protein [Rhodococcus sp. ABRD24]|uniref:nuclear transport factor 2 family protein n=1 Tax=Rhodococcus sp. ABRD24 TaxID=2507582 RepID=UPI00103B3B40|nr:nuclear transport factor 2 family protein [Rhodococcus sp. ABRD24]QBJ94541.1 nuclear transport factor 2 family protein [Rhodococcus sp. ABRD24]